MNVTKMLDNMSNASDMRGLKNFIMDIRQCKSKEAEQSRVMKELANIRKNFKGNVESRSIQFSECICSLVELKMLTDRPLISFCVSPITNYFVQRRYVLPNFFECFISMYPHATFCVSVFLSDCVLTDIAAVDTLPLVVTDRSWNKCTISATRQTHSYADGVQGGGPID